MRIATWNVNSIKARLPAVLKWLEAAAPDVAVLQEIKTTEDGFPRLEIEALGYHCRVVGQRSYNGVAMLAKAPIEDAIDRLPGDESDEQARYVEATVGGVRIGGLYLPNGNPVDSDKYPYKLAWMERLAAHADSLLASEAPAVLAGDWNVIPDEADCWDPEEWREDALFRTETRRAFRGMLYRGWTDAFRAIEPTAGGAYTFWDYQAGRWQRGEGIRIDHLLLSPAAADRLTACAIDKGPRGEPKASDHTPIWCDLAAAPLVERLA